MLPSMEMYSQEQSKTAQVALTACAVFFFPALQNLRWERGQSPLELRNSKIRARRPASQGSRKDSARVWIYWPCLP
jgi:hypothetical protein